MFGFSSPVFNDWISDPDFWRRSEPKVVKEALADLKRYHKYWGVHAAFQTWISFLKTLWEQLGQLWRFPDAEESRVLTFLTFDQQSTFDCCRSENLKTRFWQGSSSRSLRESFKMNILRYALSVQNMAHKYFFTNDKQISVCQFVQSFRVIICEPWVLPPKNGY